LHGTGLGYYTSVNPSGLHTNSGMVVLRIGFSFWDQLYEKYGTNFALGCGDPRRLGWRSNRAASYEINNLAWLKRARKWNSSAQSNRVQF